MYCCCAACFALFSPKSVEEVKARHKKELKTLDGSCRKLLKQANKNKAKTAEAEKKIIKVPTIELQRFTHTAQRSHAL